VRAGRGEIDLVCRDGESLVFVEVKTRQTDRYGRPAEAVNAIKRRRLIQAALWYLRELDNPEVRYRFDIVEVLGAELRLIQNAFGLR
jgi:putative endonuclease